MLQKISQGFSRSTEFWRLSYVTIQLKFSAAEVSAQCSWHLPLLLSNKHFNDLAYNSINTTRGCVFKHFRKLRGKSTKILFWRFFGRFQNRVFVYETFVHCVWVTWCLDLSQSSVIFLSGCLTRHIYFLLSFDWNWNLSKAQKFLWSKYPSQNFFLYNFVVVLYYSKLHEWMSLW